MFHFIQIKTHFFYILLQRKSRVNIPSVSSALVSSVSVCSETLRDIKASLSLIKRTKSLWIFGNKRPIKSRVDDRNNVAFLGLSCCILFVVVQQEAGDSGECFPQTGLRRAVACVC